MISALSCRAELIQHIEAYCKQNIEPLLLNANKNYIYFGKYDSTGDISYYVKKTYAKDPPELKAKLGPNPSHPNLIKKYLETLGYTVEFIAITETYPEGKSSSGKTTYYHSGKLFYHSLKISY